MPLAIEAGAAGTDDFPSQLRVQGIYGLHEPRAGGIDRRPHARQRRLNLVRRHQPLQKNAGFLVQVAIATDAAQRAAGGGADQARIVRRRIERLRRVGLILFLIEPMLVGAEEDHHGRSHQAVFAQLFGTAGSMGGNRLGEIRFVGHRTAEGTRDHDGLAGGGVFDDLMARDPAQFQR